MKNAALVVLIVVSVLSLAAVVTMWNDNRHLRRQMIDRSGWCVDEDSHRKLIDTCATLSDINRRDQQVLYRLREATHGPGEEGERRGHGQVWRAARHVDQGGDGRGRGGP